MCFSPDSRWLVVGLATVGTCILYEHYAGQYLNYKSRIDCRNRHGRFSSGRKVAGIAFLNNAEFLVSTNDSSVRLFSVYECSQAVKFKGHFNEHLQMIPSYDQEMITVGSEDGRVVFWNIDSLRTQATIAQNSKNSAIKLEVKNSYLVPTYSRKKERNFESFIPFHEVKNKRLNSTAIANISLFAPEAVVQRAQEIFNKHVGVDEL